ncbi:Chorismate mutase [Novosphingobium aromaticivorans]|nr:Chorismate mutase [Novosphingobium aromaticivorans]
MHDRPPRIELCQPPEPGSGSVEAIDQQILFLLSQRFGLAREHDQVALQNDDARTAQLASIRRKAFELGIPVSLVTDFWDRMLDASAAMREQARKT